MHDNILCNEAYRSESAMSDYKVGTLPSARVLVGNMARCTAGRQGRRGGVEERERERRDPLPVGRGWGWGKKPTNPQRNLPPGTRY